MAIEAKDLRSGNLILNRHGEVEEVDWMTFKDMCQPRMSGHGYTGIPLTPEWLERMGFTMDINPLIMLGTPDRFLYFAVVRGEFYPALKTYSEFANEEPQTASLNRIEYVHELQNLYWCLCGKELEVKP